MSSTNRNNLNFSFPKCVPPIDWFSGYSILNRCGETGYACLIPDFWGNCFSFSPIQHGVGWEFVLNGFYHFVVKSCYSCFHEGVDMMCYWILCKIFSVSVEVIMWFLSLILFAWYVTFVDLHRLTYPCIPRMKSTW